MLEIISSKSMSTFSILYRIVGSVTTASAKIYRDTVDFQYPLSDRGLCNNRIAVLQGRKSTSFSILYRIVGSVTA